MNIFQKEYKVSLIIKWILLYTIIFMTLTLITLAIVFSAIGYELVVSLTFVSGLFVIIIPVFIILKFPNVYPSKMKYVKIYVSYRIYVLENKKTIKKYRENYVWGKIVLQWDEELKTHDENIESWFNSWYNK